MSVSPARLRVDLFRLLGDEDRLRLLALCAAEELTVGELATLLRESQPQITRKSQPLRDAGLLHERRDGTRILLRAAPVQDPVLSAALDAGRALCVANGSLARVPALVAQREETARRLFADPPAAAGVSRAEAAYAVDALALLPMLSPLLPAHRLAVDVGTGEGTLLPLLSPLYERVVAVDRSAARLARCADQVRALGLPNVRLREGDVQDSTLQEEIARAGGADLVVVAGVLHHVARPREVVTAAARLLRPGGHVVIVDHAPHDDESLRDAGHVWLGFPPEKLRGFLADCDLAVVTVTSMPGSATPPLQIAVGRAAHDLLH